MRFLLLAACLSLTAGCSSLTLPTTLTAAKQASAKPDPDARISQVLTIWQPGEGVGADGLPTRGFAGQILFFAAGNDAPVPVDGTVRIYVFDDQNIGEDAGKPVHVFNFEAAAWPKYRRETKLGTSYHLFIPYTRPGAHQAVCSLRTKFQNARGIVLSEAADVLLEGRKRTAEVAAKPKPAIETVSYKPGERPATLPARQVDTADARMARVESMLGRLNTSKQDGEAATEAGRGPLHVHTIPLQK